MGRRAPSQPPMRQDRYTIAEQLARGGMGVVYRAFDRIAERDVAYKRLDIGDARSRPARVALFQSEFTTLAQLAHPAIVEVYEYGLDGEGPYYTMELLSGSDLRDAAPLPWQQACLHLRDVASALALLHARRLLHRDLSPANVRLTADGCAKLIDFGALSPFGRQVSLVGTPGFMAPECLDAAMLDQRSDLYALGALAYWTITGRRPVQARSLDDLPEALTRDITPPSHWVADLPKRLEELVMGLLSREPLGRPATAAEVMEQLASIARLTRERDEERVVESYLSHPPLVGREDVLARLDELLAETQAGHGKALLISAPAGAESSALLDRLAWRAQLTGVSVLRARGGQHAPEGGLAGVLVEAAKPLAARRLGSERARARSGQDLANRSSRQMAKVERQLLALSEETPLLLIIDDVHRADGASRGLLAMLAEQTSRHRLAIVASSDAEAAPSAEYPRTMPAGLELVSLPPLTQVQTAEFVRTVFGEVPHSRRLADVLYEASGGLPAHLVELARTLVRREEIQYHNGTFTLPHDVPLEQLRSAGEDPGFSIYRELGREERLVLEALSVHRVAVPFSLLAACVQRSPRIVSRSLASLFRIGLVTSHANRYTFARAGLGELIASQLDEATRAILHRRASEALLAESASDPVARCVAGDHAMLAGDVRRGAELIRGAARELVRDHNFDARVMPSLERALPALRDHGERDVDCVALLVGLALGGLTHDVRLLAPYSKRALDVLFALSGIGRARSLRRFLGARLSLAISVLAAFVRFFLTPPRRRLRSFGESIATAVTIAASAAGAAASAFDRARAAEISRAMGPLSSLGSRNVLGLMWQFCKMAEEVTRGDIAGYAQRLSGLVDGLSQPGQLKGLREQPRIRLLSTVLYGRAFVDVLRAHGDSLTLAGRIDELGAEFFRPHSELVRALYHAFRGDMQLAEEHRRRAELLALRGGASWAVLNAVTYRWILVGQWTHDRLLLVRALADLERCQRYAPCMAPFRDLAEAYLELLRGRAANAVALYERVLDPRADRVVNWISEHGRYAEALSALGEHQRAKEVCLRALSELGPREREYRILYHVPLQQLALAEAQLGDIDAAARRLDGALREIVDTAHPLLCGSLHRDRAQVAIFAKDTAGFHEHFEGMSRYFRATGTPSLIQQCDRLALRASDAGLLCARGDPSQVPQAFDSEQSDRDTYVSTTG